MIGDLSQSSRLSVGEAAARMAMEQIALKDSIDVCLTSLRGMEKIEIEEWEYEFGRAQELLSTGQGAQLFSASFSTVPSIERLSDWIATKWAPAVMKTYDIAGILSDEKDFDEALQGTRNIQARWCTSSLCISNSPR